MLQGAPAIAFGQNMALIEYNMKNTFPLYLTMKGALRVFESDGRIIEEQMFRLVSVAQRREIDEYCLKL